MKNNNNRLQRVINEIGEEKFKEISKELMEHIENSNLVQDTVNNLSYIATKQHTDLLNRIKVKE